MRRATVFAAAVTLLLSAQVQAAEDPWAAARAGMVRNIEQLAAAGAGVSRKIDQQVLRVMAATSRHLFVPETVRARAYGDFALEIGHDATISQPFIVALMTDVLQVDSDDVVLEVGTGSGYQAAVLSQLAWRVYSIEIEEPLAREAAERLQSLGYANVSVRAGDGYAGWPEHAPFDAIIVTAGATHVPKPLVAQLKPGGRLLIPVGPDASRQQLALVEKDPSGKVRTRRLAAVNFVPLHNGRGRVH